MKRDVRVLCRPVAAAGFRLAGLPVIAVADDAEAAAALRALRADPEAGLVLVEDALHLEADPRGRRHEGLPVVLPFPGPTWEAAGDDRVVEILRRAIGYRVRLV